MRTLIVIPARYGSTRLPGKPLMQIGGRSMVERTAENAKKACALIGNSDYLVATDDTRILAHCQKNNLPTLITPVNLESGTDRACYALNAYNKAHKTSVDLVINLQGDSPFTPPEHLVALHKALLNGCDVATPYVKLSWEALDQLRHNKLSTPFSGTTVIVTEEGRAVWFSKNILPAIRDEKELRSKTKMSPVNRHIGLYGFTNEALQKFSKLNKSHYENLEGLEQLRFLENNLHVQAVEVMPARISISGIDTQEDLSRAEALLIKDKST